MDQIEEAIVLSFLGEKEKYKELAEFIVHLIQDDPMLPKSNLHTITYRIKDEFRLVEKINKLNKTLAAGTSSITEKNYQASVGDLLGIRIICLRLSDIEDVGAYLKLLSEENILNFTKGPEQKKSFILPANPGGLVPEDFALGYSGYSSIHYQAELGENSNAPAELKGIPFELQLRTILEEAWGEIDHKYRYVYSRIGLNMPEHIHMGFYNLSAYLQVAALQAEGLCRLAETHIRKKGNELIEGNQRSGKDEAFRETAPLELEKHLSAIFGFDVSARTLIYIEKRLIDFNSGNEPLKMLQNLLTQDRLLEFKIIFQEILHVEPFLNIRERNIDAINAFNFCIFHEIQDRRVAQEGLRAVLRWRKNRSS